MNRRKFITTCACCACACGIAALLGENKIAETNDFVMKHIEIHIAEHCNLKCKHCYHFSCIAQKEFYDLDKFKQDMKQMSFVFKRRLSHLQLLGGEPLLNPQINEYVKISRKYFPNTRIGITTNGILLDDMNESFWKTLNENDVSIVPSIYPIKINWKSILDKAEKYDVKLYASYKTNEKLTQDNIEKNRKTSFSKIKLRQKGSNDTVHQLNCKKRFIRYVMQEGKLYICPTVAYIRHLNKKFNTNFVVTEDDYLDLYKIKNTNEIKTFLEKPSLHFCKYCERGIEKVKWENSEEHTLSEWT